MLRAEADINQVVNCGNLVGPVAQTYLRCGSCCLRCRHRSDCWRWS